MTNSKARKERLKTRVKDATTDWKMGLKSLLRLPADAQPTRILERVKHLVRVADTKLLGFDGPDDADDGLQYRQGGLP